MKYAYVRVSTVEQHEARQVDMMKKQGVSAENMFIEKRSGKNMKRPELRRILDTVQDGDALIVESYSRLARSTADLLNITDELQGKGVTLVSVKENIDTSTASGKLMLTILAGLAQFERENMLERQAEGIAAAKARGKYHPGRKKANPPEFAEIYKRVKAGEITKKQAAEILGVNRTTFYNLIERCA